ncbi:MAG: T9SS type A sorting domain-containing protein [Ignavibacteriota bacterium]|nr:MAG: T9SS type A sorting domain-containing protein [Ignavibacteriota bacterium]
MAAGLNIHHNYIHQRNKQIGVPPGQHEHVDPLQTHVIRDVKIWNNVFIIDSSVLGHGMILGIQSRPGRRDTVIIYNNYIYAGGHLNPGGNPYINGFVLRWYGYVNSVYPPTYVINNTVVTSNGGENTILQEYAGKFYNNIICQLGTNGQNPANYGGTPLETFASSWNMDKTYVDSVRSNLMWRQWTNDMSFGGNRWVGSGGSPTGIINGGWNVWTNSNWGGTGINADPLFVNNVRERYGYVIASNSPARNAGEDLQAFIESKGLPWADIEGKPRNNTPDIGAFEYKGLLGVDEELQSLNFKLYQNYPNPFNPSTTINWQSPINSWQTIKLFDILGREIDTIIDGYYETGHHSTLYVVNPSLPSGIYFYQLKAGDYLETKKLVLQK